MKNKSTLIISILLLLLVGAGCDNKVWKFLNDPKKSFDNTEYFGGKRIVEVFDEFKAKIGKPFRVESISISKGTFTMRIQDPDEPKALYKYERISDQIRERQFKGRGGDDELSFPFDEINTEVIPSMLEEILTKSKLKSGGTGSILKKPRISSMSFSRQKGIGRNQYKFAGKALWQISVANSEKDDKNREIVFVYAEPSGKILYYDYSKSEYGRNYDLINKTELRKAQNEIDSRGDEFFMTEKITIKRNQIVFETPVREYPTKLNKYTFAVNGLYKNTNPYGSPTPYKSVTERFFEAEKIDLTKALDYIEKARTELESPDGEFQDIIINHRVLRLSEEDTTLVWTVRLITNNQIGYVRFDIETGKVVEADKAGHGE